MAAQSDTLLSDARLALSKQPGHILHIIYQQGGVKHDDHYDCWCQPVKAYEDPDTSNTVWIHRMRQ